MFAGHAIVGTWLSTTVTVNEHEFEFDDASVAVHVTVVVPTGNVDPDAGTHVTVAPGQLSDATGTVYETLAEHWPDVAGALTFAGQVNAGACVSVTVTVKLQLPVFEDASVAVHVTVVVPTGNVAPVAGTQVTGPVPGQLSVAAGVEKATTAEHWPAVFGTLTFAGQANVGACVSLTVTVNEHEPVFEEASLAVQVTVVVPTGKLDPEGGKHATVDPGQLSEAAGVAKFTTAEHCPAVFPTVTFAGQTTVGG